MRTSHGRNMIDKDHEASLGAPFLPFNLRKACERFISYQVVEARGKDTFQHVDLGMKKEK